MLLIEASHVSFSYGDKQIYDDINFRLLEGEHIALVGHNGAGKSTFFNLLLGRLLPDSGRIDRSKGLSIGVIAQHVQLKKKKTIYESLQEAFQSLFAAEHEMSELAARMEKGDAAPALLERYGQLQDLLLTDDFYTVDARIRDMSDGLGLTAIGLDKKITQLSGGQLTKVCLARLLLEKPGVLLLDEPTNYLDVAHIHWLTGYLRNYPHAFIVISHDAAFLNHIAQFVYHVENHQLFRYVGNYQSYLRQREARHRQQEIAFRQQQKEIKKLETYIQKNKVRTATARQAQSRAKQLDKIVRLDPPGKEKKPRFQFQVVEQPVRVLLTIEQLEVGYDRPLFPELTARIVRGEKIAVTGHNGIGKTTLLRTLLGSINPLSGRAVIGERVYPGYFSQLSVPSSLTPIEWMMERFPTIPEKTIRQHLAQCGVYAEHMRRPMNTLSGGEETKVRLGKLMLEKSNMLIFDEPTNHLDVESKHALSEALESYEGTVLIVSHEPSFYKPWITQVWDIEAWS